MTKCLGQQAKRLFVREESNMLIAGCILAALAIGALIYLAVKLTISFLKKYRTKKNNRPLIRLEIVLFAKVQQS